MIFPHLEYESTVQVNDRTRLDATKSFTTQDQAAVTKIEIDPGTGSFINITPSTATDTTQWYLDYQWDSAGSKTVRLRITAGTTETISRTVTVVTEAADALFSTDQALASHEPDILKWVKAGRNTFKDVHRAAQTEILDWLDEKGYVDTNGNKLTKAAIVDTTEVRQWAKFMALRMIFEGIQNAEDDVFQKKADAYGAKEASHRNRAILRLDEDGDGAVDESEGAHISTGNIFKR